jgi:hypothetical protein
MAHECPECGQTCYCGGDVDDCEFHDTYEELHCTHCPIDGLPDEDELEPLDQPVSSFGIDMQKYVKQLCGFHGDDEHADPSEPGIDADPGL